MRKRFLLLVFTTMAILLCQRLQGQVVVIANPSVSTTEISRSDLRDLFTGVSTSVKSDTHVTPYLLKEGPAHEEMLSAYIGKSDSAFRATWRSLVFSGQGVMPRSLDSEASVVSAVAHTPGAIGYINRSTPHDGVKLLVVR